MARRKRRTTDTAPGPRRAEVAEQAPRQRAALPEWRWFTFPVFFAFALGAVLMALLNGEPNNDVAAVAQIIALAALSYGAARIFVRKVFAERRMREGRRPPSQPAADDEYEDVVVYPEETKERR